MSALAARLRGSRPAPELLAGWAILLIAIGAIAAAVVPTLGDPGHLSAWDAAGHRLRAYDLVHNLLPSGHLSGWFPWWNGGYDGFQSYPPLVHYLLGGLLLVLDDELALRVLVGALWAALVPAHYYLLRSFELERPVAALGAGLMVAFNASYGFGPGALYGVGLLANGLGAVLAIVLLGRLKRDLSDTTRGWRPVVLTGVLLGLLVVAHTFSAYFSLVVSVALVAAEAWGSRARAAAVLRRYAAVLGLGALLSAWWWIPMLMGRGNMSLPVGAGGNRSLWERIEPVLLADDSGGPAITALALVGITYLALSRCFRTLAFFTLATALTVALATDLLGGFVPFADVIGSAGSRFFGFTTWLVVALAGFGIAGAWALARRLPRPVAVAAMAVAALVVAQLVVRPELEVHRGFVGVADTPETRQLPELTAALDRELLPGDFLLVEFGWDQRATLGTPHLVTQELPRRVDRAWILNGSYGEGTAGAEAAYLLSGAVGDIGYLRSQRSYLLDRGVRFLVTTSADTAAALAFEPWLEPVPDTGPALKAFELAGSRAFGLPAPAAGELAAADFSTADQAYTLRFRNDVDLPEGSSLALSYHPWLRVRADGAELAVRKGEDRTLRVAESADGVRDLEIAYRRPPLAVAGTAVSGLTVAVLLVLAYRRRWPRRRPA